MTEPYIYIKSMKTMPEKIIGIIKTETNGDQTAIDFTTRQVLGYYRADRDVTTDFYGRILARGNVVSTLFKQDY